MTPNIAELRQEMFSFRDWYHKIDLGNGLITPGRDYEKIWHVCRSTMDRVDFRGKRVLDIGACDGLWAFEAERRGAALVVATDLFDYALERFLFCRRVLKSRVIPFYNVSIYDLVDSLGRHLCGTSEPFAHYGNKFDIVMFFGVLYHLRDPMLGLSQVRSVVRDNGAVLLETAYVYGENKPVMLFGGGEKKRLYPDVSNWWAPSLSCLKEMCQTSLLSPSQEPETTLIQDPLMGRVGLRLHPIAYSELAPDFAYEARLHYRIPLPRS
jgi:tRNA (mo5U34)-methyltransferase